MKHIIAGANIANLPKTERAEKKKRKNGLHFISFKFLF